MGKFNEVILAKQLADILDVKFNWATEGKLLK